MEDFYGKLEKDLFVLHFIYSPGQSFLILHIMPILPHCQL